MCLLAMAYKTHPVYDLVLITNRDEYFKRPSQQARFWEDAPDLLAGRDLEGSGTWMGITRTGRLALLTNYRDPKRHKKQARTRGLLVSGFLKGSMRAEEYLHHVSRESSAYNDFNLIAGTRESLLYFSSTEGLVREIPPGVHGMSNHLLDTRWPKVEKAENGLRSNLNAMNANADLPVENLFSLLSDSSRAPDDRLPDTGVGLEWERALSSIFITAPNYGTRCSTILAIRASGEAEFHERTHPPERDAPSTVSYRFPIKTDPA